ncbi:acyl-CoA thioesterase [Propionicimonas sp.]|uniref:acyl-CoA thioesterase n=1 Tax=Propionicimonas sp. TaxID=1955623 RepID=UPI0039E33C07
MEPTGDAREPHGMMVLRTLAMPGDTNPWGDVFGGWLLSQMDIAAGLMAGEVAQGRSATVSVQGVVFHSPVAVGQAICIYADLVRVGRSSMEIALEVWARDLVHLYEPDRAFVAEAVFHYVAVDAEGRPRPVPENPAFRVRND